MSTVASLQIKIGADVSAAISGLSRAEFAADQVKEAYIAANNTSVQTGAAIAVWSQNFTTAAAGIKREIDAINTDNLDAESQSSVANLKNIIDAATKVSQSVTVMSAAFSGAQAIAGPALAGIARLIPSIGASLAALAGPIGLAVGLAAALGAAYLSNASSINKVLTEEQKLNQQITQEIAQAGVLFGVLKSGNLTNEKRGALIEDINKKYDTTLKNLKDETAFVAQVDIAYQKLGESIKNKILLAGSQKELEGLIAQQIQTEKYKEGLLSAGKAVDVLNKQLADIGASPSQQFDPKTFLGGAQGVVDVQSKIDGQQDIINKKLADMAGLYNKVFTNIGGGSKGAESDADKIKKIYEKLGNDIAGLQTNFGKGIITGSELDEGIATLNKKAIDGIQSIDPKSDFLVPLYAAVAQFISDTQKTAFNLNITPKIDTSDFISQVDTIRSNAFEKLEDIDLKFKFTGSGEDALKEKISAVQQALQELGTLNVPVDDDAVQVLLAELAILKSQTDSPFLIDVQVKDLSFAERFKKEIESLQQALDIAGQIGSALSGALGQSNDNEFEAKRQALDAYYERESELIESSVSNDALKNSRKVQLETEVAQKRKQIARQEAQAQRNLNIFEATINTANAVTKALTAGPIAGPILAAVIGGLGLAQIAAIASAPLPALAGGALVTGPSFVQVGEYPGAAQNPEFISPVDKAQKYIREAVQQAGGGGAQELYSFVSGDDIVLVSDRANYRKQRLG